MSAEAAWSRGSGVYLQCSGGVVDGKNGDRPRVRPKAMVQRFLLADPGESLVGLLHLSEKCLG